MRVDLLMAGILAVAAAPAIAQAVPDLGANLERFDYPAPVSWFEAPAGNGAVRMAYIELTPDKPNGRTLVLLHGKNFCAATWHETAVALVKAGYRVLSVDQVGFCKSSKPADFQYSEHALMDLTARLLDSRGIDRVTLVGHSMGGALAARFALLWPKRVEQLVMVNPLSLNDRLAEGGRYTPLATLLENERKTTPESIKAYQLAAYYHGEWRPEYDQWVTMRAGMYQGADREVMVNAQARTSDMLQTQPIAADLPRLAVPTTLVIGMLDTTGAGLQGPPRPVRAAPGSIAGVAEMAVTRIPGGQLVRLEGLGHSPQVEDPATFQRTLLQVLERQGGDRP